MPHTDAIHRTFSASSSQRRRDKTPDGEYSGSEAKKERRGRRYSPSKHIKNYVGKWSGQILSPRSSSQHKNTDTYSDKSSNPTYSPRIDPLSESTTALTRQVSMKSSSSGRPRSMTDSTISSSPVAINADISPRIVEAPPPPPPVIVKVPGKDPRLNPLIGAFVVLWLANILHSTLLMYVSILPLLLLLKKQKKNNSDQYTESRTYQQSGLQRTNSTLTRGTSFRAGAGDVVPPQRRMSTRMRSRCRLVLTIGNGKSSRICVPNDPPFAFTTNSFQGSLYVHTRMPGDAYFEGKKRMFEIYIQGQFTTQPTGEVWFGIEQVEPLVLGMVKKSIWHTALRFVRSFRSSSSLHASLGDKQQCERPHMVLPVLSFMDIVIDTPPGSTPPNISQGGVPSTPPPGSRFFTKGSPSDGSTFEVGHTYTMIFWNAYLDFESWCAIGIPGFGKYDMHNMIQDLPIHLTMYSLPKNTATHSTTERKEFLHFEIIHSSHPNFTRTE